MRVMVMGLMAVAACCPSGPVDLEVPAPPGAERAIALVRSDYAEVFGRNPAVRVRWTSADWFDSSGTEIMGQAWGCKRIWVATTRTGRISDSALAHELAHCYSGDIRYCGLVSDNEHSESWIWDREGGLVAYENGVVLAGAGL